MSENEVVGPDSFGGEDYPSAVPVETVDAPSEDAPMFKFDGSEYPYLVVNRTGNVGATILSPATNKPMAIVGAYFGWTEVQPFVEHQNIGNREERNVREDESYRKRGSITANNVRLLKETCQGGYIIPLDEVTGEQGAQEEKTRDEVLAYPQELQSKLMNEWLGGFHIERFFPNGAPSISALLSTPESVFFKVRVGDYKQPTHMLVLEYDAPSPDARRAYETDTFAAASKQENEKAITTYIVDYLAKYRFGKKYLKSVQGVALAKDGEVHIDTADLRIVDPTSAEDMKLFGLHFNPNWFMRLADALFEAFDYSGK